MALTIKFLTNIRGFLKDRNGEGLRDWLKVEPPLPQDYLDLAAELKGGYRNNDAVAQLVDQCLPDEDDLPEDQGNAWGGFRAFMREYFAYWRDVDFEDLLGAHQLLVSLTTACQTALNHPTYGTIMYQTSISLCASLSKLSMTLNKRPDLTRQLRTMVDAGGEEEQKSIVEHTTEIIQKIFTACLSDRSSLRNAQPEGKKVGVYIFANVTLKLLFACRKTQIATQVFTKITQNSPPLSFYPAAQRVTYLYYLGRFHFINNHYRRAARCLQEAYLQTPPSFQKHRTLILTYLIPSNMLLGRLPSPALLQRPEAHSLAPVFLPLARAIRAGSFPALQHAVEAHKDWLLRKGLLLTLTYRLRALVWRTFTRRVFLITYVPHDEDDNSNRNNNDDDVQQQQQQLSVDDEEEDSRIAAMLELPHLLTAAQFVQKKLEGYVPAHPTPKGGRPPSSGGNNINPMLLRAITNRAGTGTGGAEHSNSTLVPPPGGPRRLGPNEGLVWGNMPVTAEHIEAIVASLVAQGLMVGFIAHAQARFVVTGPRTKSPVALGWPNVAEVTVGDDREEIEQVPGWVRDRDAV
ncbi:putative pci domain-containing protein [Eutypa lata UCREL1]|uniref:Putative pci domain-containing protein n=1 Tax=Eutypa lata (strain UCR-EL1) TaxID=1287681 RepID=M7SV99_EUTLA|nr:putative pci domain-containing protein [Eutypa lata UCREL1]